MKGRRGTSRPLPSRLPSPAESPGFLLWKVSNTWQRRQRAALQPFGLTHSQFVLLATATWFSATETLTQARLAELSGVDRMTTSQIVRTLEAAALLERREHPKDPRAKAVFVTDAGRRKAHAALVAVEDTDAAFFDPIAARSKSLLKIFRALVSADSHERSGTTGKRAKERRLRQGKSGIRPERVRRRAVARLGERSGAG